MARVDEIKCFRDAGDTGNGVKSGGERLIAIPTFLEVGVDGWVRAREDLEWKMKGTIWFNSLLLSLWPNQEKEIKSMACDPLKNWVGRRFVAFSLLCSIIRKCVPLKIRERRNENKEAIGLRWSETGSVKVISNFLDSKVQTQVTLCSNTPSNWKWK